MVHLLEIIKSVTHVVNLQEEGHQECSSSEYYQVRHPRGAFKEEGRQECSSSEYYQVRHPRGASTEEGRQERSSSEYHQVRYPRDASYGRRSSRTLLFLILLC